MSGKVDNQSNNSLESKKFSYSFTVGEDLLDDYNHVNNARYLDLYEEARWAILDKSSLGRDFVRSQGIGPVILEVNIKFRQEIKQGTIITIETTSKNDGNRIFHFFQTMKDAEGNLYSSAVFKTALFNLKTRKMLRADDTWIKAFGH